MPVGGLHRRLWSRVNMPPNKRLKLAGGDRSRGSRVLCPGGHGLASTTLAPVRGLSHATRAATVLAAAVGAFGSFLALAIGEGPLLRRLGLYCPQCGTPLVGGSDDRVPTEVVVCETGQCRCSAWLLDPADLPSGQGPDERYLPLS